VKVVDVLIVSVAVAVLWVIVHVIVLEVEDEVSLVVVVRQETVIYYPDKTRSMLIENYYYNNIDLAVIEEYTNIMQDYTILNRNKLINLVKVNIGNNIPIM